MKYCIEGEYNNNCMEGKMQIQDSDKEDLKDFIMYGMPGLIQDLFDKLGASLKEKAKENDISYDKIIGVMSLMSIMCQNTLSEKLTESLNKFLADDPIQEEKEDDKEINGNPWNLLLGDN